MSYKVIKYFTDLQDNRHPYNVGDIYPREGVKPSDDRIAELAGSENKQGCPLIELVKEAKNLDKMNKAELQAYAKEKGVALDDADTKEKIIAKIKEAEEAAAK